MTHNDLKLILALLEYANSILDKKFSSFEVNENSRMIPSYRPLAGSLMMEKIVYTVLVRLSNLQLY